MNIGIRQEPMTKAEFRKEIDKILEEGKDNPFKAGGCNTEFKDADGNVCLTTGNHFPEWMAACKVKNRFAIKQVIEAWRAALESGMYEKDLVPAVETARKEWHLAEEIMEAAGLKEPFWKDDIGDRRNDGERAGPVDWAYRLARHLTPAEDKRWIDLHKSWDAEAIKKYYAGEVYKPRFSQEEIDAVAQARDKGEGK